jgi:selenide,water dikinase
LAQVLSRLPKVNDPRLLVGTSTADDAGVYLVQPGLALVQTVDVLTPVVPDPYTFGQIAAANSLSDVYAMGGQPLTALNVIGFPAAGNKDWLVQILLGIQNKIAEAGACIVGGHTFNDPEIKVGLAVTGLIDPARIVTNDRARPGDVLILTKPLGSGTLSQALMTIDDIPTELMTQGVRFMTTLNRAASEAMLKAGVVCATDITGFGLVGHLQEMVKASGVAAVVNLRDLPVMPGALELIGQGVLNPGAIMNEASFGKMVRIDGLEPRVNTGEYSVNPSSSVVSPPLPSPLVSIAYESENSGGLLMAVGAAHAGELLSRLKSEGVPGAVIGRIIDESPGLVILQI